MALPLGIASPCSSISYPFPSPFSSSFNALPKLGLNHSPPFLSLSSSFAPQSSISLDTRLLVSSPTPLIRNRQAFVVHAAWTRRSKGDQSKRPSRKSWKQRTDMYMRPFMLNVFFSKRFVHAKVVHRGTSKVISVASTNAKDLRNKIL